MPYIHTPPGLPGIIGLFAFDKETAVVLSQLAETLLRRTSSLTPAQREAIAAAVSAENNCNFCFNSHKAAEIALGGREPYSEKLNKLLDVAKAVAKGGKMVSPRLVNAAFDAGASEQELHDTVLIAAAFCMYNRYVDGLGTISSCHTDDYKVMGMKLANEGYMSTVS